MREQIRLWFYSALHGGRPDRACAGASSATRRCSTKRAVRCTACGQYDRRAGRVRPDGCGRDALQYCSQPPDRNLLFGFGPAHEIQRPRRSGTASSSSTTRTSSVGRRISRSSSTIPTLSSSRSTAVERTHALVAERRSDTRAGSRSTSFVPMRRSSTTSRTGTSGARVVGSGMATRSRQNALVRARARGARRRAADAVPRRSSVAGAHRAVRECTAVRPSRRLAEPVEPDAAMLAEIVEPAAWSSSDGRRARPRG